MRHVLIFVTASLLLITALPSIRGQVNNPVAYPLLNQVTIDGKYSSSSEWNDTTAMRLEAGIGGVAYFSAKYDSNYLYTLWDFLECKISFSGNETSSANQVFLYLDPMNKRSTTVDDTMYRIAAWDDGPPQARVWGSQGLAAGGWADWASIDGQFLARLQYTSSPYSQIPHMILELRIALTFGDLKSHLNSSIGMNLGFWDMRSGFEVGYPSDFNYKNPSTWGTMSFSHTTMQASFATTTATMPASTTVGTQTVSIPGVRRQAVVPLLKFPVQIDGVWTSADEWSDANELAIKASNGTTMGYLRMKYGNGSIYILGDIFSKPALQGSGCNNKITLLDTVLIDFDLQRQEGLSLSPSQLQFAVTGDITDEGRPCVHNIWRGGPSGWVLVGAWGNTRNFLGSAERIASLKSPYDPYSTQAHIVVEARITLPLPGVQMSNPIGFAFEFFSQGNPNFPEISWPDGAATSMPLTWGDVSISGYTTVAVSQPFPISLPESIVILSVAIVLAALVLSRNMKRR